MPFTTRTRTTSAVSESTSLTKNLIITQLTKSPHGKLEEYVEVGQKAAAQEPEFFAHLIAWDRLNGQIRDAHVALPVVSLSAQKFPAAFEENSLAHIASLSPRDLLRALSFAKTVKTTGRTRKIRAIVEKYLKARESDYRWFDRTVLQHREAVKSLYAIGHVNASDRARQILFFDRYPAGSVFAAVQQLKNMSAKEAAGTILNYKIPFLIAQGALGDKAKDPDLVLAMLQIMSPAEIQTNMRMLEKLGVMKTPVLKAALEEALGRMAEKPQRTVKLSAAHALKTSKATAAVKDEKLKAKMEAVQEKQIANLKGIEGNWVVLADKSGSMQEAIEVSRHVAATLAKFVRGQVHLIFFDISPRYVDATGKTYDQLVEATKYVTANGGTSIGCGLLAAVERKADIDGIVVVSDAAENSAPAFVHVYGPLCQTLGKSVPVYLYRMAGRVSWQDVDLSLSMRKSGFDLQEFDLRGGVDYYSLPNLIQTMRSNRYSLADEIMETPLLTIADVLKERAA